MPTEASPSPLRPGSIMQQLDLYNCLIEVTRCDDEDTKSALFSLSCYLTDPTGTHQDGKLDCNKLSYKNFEEDISGHFKYDPENDEIRWDNKSSFQSDTNASGSQAKVFVVKSHNSWVTALLAMQSAAHQASSGSHSISAVGPIAMTARFIIVRSDYESQNDPDYSDSAQSDHSSTSGEDNKSENHDSSDCQSENDDSVKSESD
ncbi:hypothetical protein N7457_000579 [Penicillium paradoxum]|uniref:uncharacterized protein n=1 Tax=Penicillium paradoxum TaxID=176176 RepID=UPI00254737E4|nr:uncharacterized protein N7457_000579 [Penicillium paradoxum]KAJ5793980.1 hypothetical protein N7457_000579 [Penicillium paradoxum]